MLSGSQRSLSLNSSVCWYNDLSVFTAFFPLIFLKEWNVGNEGFRFSVRSLRDMVICS